MPPPLDPVLHQATRLRIMTMLYRNRRASFTDLRDGCGLTAGNLASHVARLEEAGYVKASRVLVDLSFEVTYRITDAGSEAFRAYLEALQAFIDEARRPAPAPATAPAREPDGPAPC